MRAWHFFIVLILVFGLGLKVGIGHADTKHQAAMAEQKATLEERKRLAAEDALQRLQTAQDRGDELTLQLAEQARQITTLTEEKRHALKQVTSGRACLGTAALRLLDGSPGLRVADLPAAASSAAVGDGPVATDTDIGQWSIAAGAQFELCRQRLGKLIAWHRGQP